MTPKWNECPSDSYGGLSSHENEKKDGNVYKRRKIDNNSDSLEGHEEAEGMPTQSCMASDNHSSLLLPVGPSEATFPNFTAGKMDPIPEVEEPPDVPLDPNSGVNDRCSVSSMSPSFMMLNKKDAAECSMSNIDSTEPITVITSPRALCIAILRKDGLITQSQTVNTLAEFTDRDANRRACNICRSLEHPLKMLICDSCEAAFHLHCCIRSNKKLPADEWYCAPCSRKKPKSLYGKLSEGKVKSSRNMSRRPHGMSHIEYMFKDTEPYVTGVRIGKDFQAEVPELSGPTLSSDGYFDAPSEFDPDEFTKSNWRKPYNQNISIGNWIKCQQKNTGDSSEPVACGKYRRAPLYVDQSDDWDCSCCLPWDPAHADCAVPQELPTEEVLDQLKYVDMLKKRWAQRA